MIDRANLFHPRRAAIGAALAKAIPVTETESEATVERKLLRRLEIDEAVRK